MSNWLVPEEALSENQRRAVELPPNRHRLIVGPAGSGKSQVILHRARYLASLYSIPPERFRIVVFSNAFRRYLLAASPLLGIPAQCITTFRHLCFEYYRTHMNKTIRMHTTGIGCVPRPYLREIFPDVKNHARKSTGPAFDFILVDDAQDLDFSSILLFRMLARHVTLTFDEEEQIDPDRASEADILTIFGLSSRSLTLERCLRCNPHITELAAALMENPAEKRAFLDSPRELPQHRETPLLYYARPFFRMEHLATIVRERQLAGERVAVIVPTQKCMRRVTRQLARYGVEVESGSEWNFASMKPKILTCHGCKGMTFDTVCIPFLEDKSPWNHLSDISRFLFRTITRATRWVYLGSNSYIPLPVIESLLPLEKEGTLAVRDYVNESTCAAPPPSENDSLDFL